MKLKKLEIELKQWGAYSGRYVGEVEYEGAEGKVCMTLSPDVSLAVLAACGANIAALTKESADQLHSAVQQSIAEAKQGPALNA